MVADLAPISKLNRKVRCPKCGQMAKKLVFRTGKRHRAKRVVTFPLTLEHIDVDTHKPKTFQTRSDLVRYCNEKNLASGAL